VDYEAGGEAQRGQVRKMFEEQAEAEQGGDGYREGIFSPGDGDEGHSKKEAGELLRDLQDGEKDKGVIENPKI